jgi:hypothetical protein
MYAVACDCSSNCIPQNSISTAESNLKAVVQLVLEEIAVLLVNLLHSLVKLPFWYSSNKLIFKLNPEYVSNLEALIGVPEFNLK